MLRVKEEEVEVKVEDGQSKYLCADCHKRFLYSFTLGRHMAAQECAKEVKVEEIARSEASAGNVTHLGNLIIIVAPVFLDQLSQTFLQFSTPLLTS